MMFGKYVSHINALDTPTARPSRPRQQAAIDSRNDFCIVLCDDPASLLVSSMRDLHSVPSGGWLDRVT